MDRFGQPRPSYLRVSSLLVRRRKLGQEQAEILYLLVETLLWGVGMLLVVPNRIIREAAARRQDTALIDKGGK